MTTALALFTDGRRDMVARTVPSLMENLWGTIVRRYIFDDSGDREYARWLMRNFPSFEVIAANERRGFGGSIANAWRFLDANLPDSVEWIWHQEDDFTFNCPVDLTTIRATLQAHPYLMQMALRRQPWNEIEQAYGGIVETNPEAYSERVSPWVNPRPTWLEHRLFFTTNPCLYRRDLIKRGWPEVEHSEGVFTHQLLEDPAVRFGFWGRRSDPPMVEHIGRLRVGVGY